MSFKSGPIAIHGRILKPRQLVSAQNRTARFVWRKLRRWSSYLIADVVGAGKSYIALSLAFGLWRLHRSRRRPFRILILAGPSELSHSWFQKTAGQLSDLDARIGDLVQIAGRNSFSRTYLEPGLKYRIPKVAVFHLRYKRDRGRLKAGLREAKHDNSNEVLNLSPNRQAKDGRIEIVITSPSWAKRLLISKRKDRIWNKWLRRTDVLIADEIFGAKNPGTVYGKILRPGPDGARYHLWRKRRPWLIGLSATLLSRDIVDAREVLNLCLNWRAKNQLNEKVRKEIKMDLDSFSRALRLGIRSHSADSSVDHLKAYKKVKGQLERILPEVVVRTLRPLPRKYQFWPGGHVSSNVFGACADTPEHFSIKFPTDGPITPLIESLQNALSRTKDAPDGLEWFLQQRSYDGSSEKFKQDAWTRITESYPANTSISSLGNHRHPKLGALLEWLKIYYKRSERSWLERRSTDDFRFKLLIYVHHVKTASDLNPRSRIRSGSEKPMGQELRRTLRRLMSKTCTTIASRNPDLFNHGNLEQPQTALAKILDKHGWTIRSLKRSDLTLLLAACVNAHKATSLREKLRRFENTLEGSKINRQLQLFHRVIRFNPKIRYKIFEMLGYKDIVTYENELKRKRKKLNVTPTATLLDPEALDLSKPEKEKFLKILPELEPKLNSAASVFERKGVVLRRNKKDIDDIIAGIAEFIPQSLAWMRRIKRFAQSKERGIARLRHFMSSVHRIPWEIAVQTGKDSKTRNFIADRFRSPGNPFVLVLTNVCTMGIDLHTYCWDVLHYTPAWTPHEAEQKTGRIDRPRLVSSREKLNIGKETSLQEIRVHHLIWPFTYDERILSRLNLRAQLSERLLGSKFERVLEKTPEDSAQIQAALFKPLNLSPK
jgi:hypothetical protein